MRAWITAIAVLAGACATGTGAGTGTERGAPPLAAAVSAAEIAAALADPRRPEADTTRDGLRHPADILAFTGVARGWRIADIGPGAGYYTRLFAVAVGPEGRVYAIDRPNAPDRPPRAILAVAPAYANVSVVQQGYQGWSVEPLDAIFISQIYHDFFLPQLSIDVDRLDRELFPALKPGGELVVIDHAAADGSDISVTNTLHRIDRGEVVRRLQAAGFVLEAESDVLRNPADSRAERVFEADIRGHTDQFTLRFRKPRS